jgi:hypothetical protein
VTGSKPRFHIIFAGGFALLLTFAVWSLISPDSWVHDYLQRNYDIPSSGVLNFLAVIQLIPTILAMIVSGNVHGGGEGIYWVLAFGQWFLIGLCISYIVGFFARKRMLPTRSVEKSTR